MKITATLLDSVTTNTNGPVIDSWQGGRYAYVDLSGTIDTATVTIYFDIGNGYNTNTSELAMTELGVYTLGPIPVGAKVRATVSSVGVSTDLSCLMVNA